MTKSIKKINYYNNLIYLLEKIYLFNYIIIMNIFLFL